MYTLKTKRVRNFLIFFIFCLSGLLILNFQTKSKMKPSKNKSKQPASSGISSEGKAVKPNENQNETIPNEGVTKTIPIGTPVTEEELKKMKEKKQTEMTENS